ncbi:MAG TPA: hypothetical protein VFV79_07040 [Saprospiraceae bacterium]|nr:hypothetical protein [Saprospiraceae bacterium]
MEPYIPLVKAIIISTMFTWGTSEVVITDQYILRENIQPNQKTGIEIKKYEVYDINRNVIHRIDPNMDYRVSIPTDSFFIKHQPRDDEYEDTERNVVEVAKQKYEGYPCKVVKRTMKVSKPGNGIFVEKEVSDYSYFGKIPWLSSVLDTEQKRAFAGFERQQYAPYYYILYDYVQWPGQEPKDNILRIIEKKEVDTTFIHTLLSLPLRDN